MRNWSLASLARLAAVLLVVGSSVRLGFTEGVAAARTAVTLGQQVAAATQCAYGVLGVLAIAALLARRRVAGALFVAWSLAVIVTATVAPVVWGQADVSTGLYSGVIAVVITALVTWGARRHVEHGLRRTDGAGDLAERAAI